MKINKKVATLLLAVSLITNGKYTAKASDNKIVTEKYVNKKYVIILDCVNVREYPSIESRSLGVIGANAKLELVTKLDCNWCAVKYNDTFAYIKGEYCKIIEEKELKDEYLKNAMVKEDLVRLNTEIPKYEVVELVEKFTNSYKVKYNDSYYIIEDKDLEKLSGKYVVVDISDQNVKLYQDNDVIFESPCVSGKLSTPTEIGDHYIFEITHNRNLVGPDYQSYVDVMMKFYEGQGLHDAEYHKDYDENGKLIKSHGWRNLSEFGGETYINNGSHGCVNMPHDKAIELSEKVNVGTRVLVKK